MPDDPSSTTATRVTADSSQPTPAAQGYSLPAEWAPHEGTWFSWPHNFDTWNDKLEAVEDALVQAVRALCMGETIHINALHEAHEERIYQLLKDGGIPASILSSAIRFHLFPTNDAWCRDHGGIFVVRPKGSKRRAVTDWGYNAWGGKYPPYDLDDAIPRKMARALGLPRFEMDMILEGGSIETNGAGLLLTTRSCLLNPNRNPDLTQTDIEKLLRDGLGVQKVLWLEGELVGDDTDGHIDNLARFVSEDTVVAAVEADRDDENYAALQDNLERLKGMTTVDSQPLQVVTLPMPALLVVRGRRMPASYANFYIGNDVVLLPAYRDPNDAVARATLQDLFPTRRVIPIDCTDVIWGYGAFHCLTQQVPAAL